MPWKTGILVMNAARRHCWTTFMSIQPGRTRTWMSYNCGIIAAGALLQYLYGNTENSARKPDFVKSLFCRKIHGDRQLDQKKSGACAKLCVKSRKRGSLLWVLDKTKTAMGARLLRSFIEQPLIDKEEISKQTGSRRRIERQCDLQGRTARIS